MRYLFFIFVLLLPCVARAQTSCTPNNNTSFSISGSNGSTLSSSTPLAAGQYTVGVTITMPGVSNSGACFPVVITGQASGTGGVASVTINGASSGVTVAGGASLTVAVANGPGNPTDWVAICNSGAATAANCDGSGYAWDYLAPTGSTCSRTAPATGVTSASCILTAPSPATTTNYVVNFLSNNGYTVLASAPFTVTGANMAVVQSQLTTQAPVSGQVCTLALNTPVKTGDTVIGYLHSSGVLPPYNIEETTTAITDNAGNSYSSTPYVHWNDFSEDIRLFYAVGVAGSPSSVSFDFSQYAPNQPICNVGIVEYSGVQSVTITNPIQISGTITPSISITPPSPATVYVFGTTQIAGQKFATLTTPGFSGVIDNFDFDGIGVWSSAATEPAASLTLNFTENPSNPNVYAAVALQSAGGVTGGTSCSDPDQSANIIAGLGLSCNTAVSDDFDGTSVDTTKWGFWDCTNSCATAPVAGGINSLITVQSGYLRETELPDHSVHFLESVNAENLQRPLFVEYRVRYMSADGSCIFCNGNAGYRLQEWSYGGGGTDWWDYSFGTVKQSTNVPEIDFNETFANNLRAGVNLWNWNGSANAYASAIIQPTTSQTLGDNTNWHVVQMLLSPSGGTNGTTTWWVDGVQQGAVQNPGPSVLNGLLSNLGSGYYYILSGYCNPNQGACAQNSYHDIDYFHVYQASSTGGGAPTITSPLTANGTVGTAFNYQIAASNNPTSFNATGLPGGLSVNTGTGAISGTPTAAGVFNVVVSAVNASGTGSATLTLTINTTASPTIAVNGSSTGTTVNAGSSLSVAVNNGPGNLYDWIGICNPGTPSSANCDGAGYSWVYLKNCVPSPPPTGLGVLSNTCTTLTAPSPTNTTSYTVNFFSNNTYTVLASAPITVTGTGVVGGGGVGCSNPDQSANIIAGLGLTCNTAVSDDFDGTSIDATKWHVPSCGTTYTEGNGYLHHIGASGNGCGAMLSLNQENLRRPLFVEYRVRYSLADGQCLVCEGNGGYRFQEWSCGAPTNNVGACVFDGTGTIVNVPEIDFNETFSNNLRAGVNLWNNGQYASDIIQPATPQTLEDNTNFHVIQMLLSPNGGTNGTTAWWVDGVEQGSVANPWIQTLHPEQSSLGSGMTFVIGGGCFPTQGACITTGFHDIDYFHVYQPSGTGAGAPATIIVNGTSGGTTVAAGSSLSVAVANGPANPRDWIGVCNLGTASLGTCNGGGYSWAYIQNCSTSPPTPPTAGVSSATCPLTAPSPTSTTSYAVNFFSNDTYTVLASAPITVNGTGGGGGGGGGPGCSDSDSGMGASLGLTCQSSLSDDFDTTIDTSKWSVRGSPYIQCSGGICYLVTFGTNTNGVMNTANGGLIGLRNGATDRLTYMEAKTQIVNWPSIANTAQFWSCASTNLGDCDFGVNGQVNVPEIDINETFYQGLSGGANLWNNGSYGNAINGCGTGVGCDGPILDGNWHILALKVDPTTGPNGTVTWYVDGRAVQVFNPSLPYWVHPELSNRGVGYLWVMGNGCIGGGCGNGTMYQNYDYFHVYW